MAVAAAFARANPGPSQPLPSVAGELRRELGRPVWRGVGSPEDHGWKRNQGVRRPYCPGSWIGSPEDHGWKRNQGVRRPYYPGSFATYVAIVAQAHPGLTADMLAYMYLIVREASKFWGMGWLTYDANFRRNKEGLSVPWNAIDSSLYHIFIANQKTRATPLRDGGMNRKASVPFCMVKSS